MPDTLTIRPAATTEQEALEELQHRASLAWEEYREVLLANPDAIELPARQIADARVDVAEFRRKPAGFSVVLPRPDGNADLDGLFVEPVLWKRGIGRLLVEAAVSRALLMGATYLYVIANPRALGFYARCRFEEAGETQTRFGAAFVMRRRVR
jgi:GNAT superfamily N-acetyltransferase